MRATAGCIKGSGLHVMLQLADFMVNLDTREHVQKLQLEVKECSDGLCSLQHHLETGFAEVKDKIDETHDRYTPCTLILLFHVVQLYLFCGCQCPCLRASALVADISTAQLQAD